MARRFTMPSCRKLRIEASERLVAPGPLGVRLPEHASGTNERDARAFGLLSGAVLPLFDPPSNALVGKLGTVVQLERRRHL